MAIVENIREWFSGENAKNKKSSILAGLLFFAAWWFLIDVLATSEKGTINTGQAFIGVFGTISFFMVNTVRKSHINDNPSVLRGRLAMLWLLIGFILGFASVIAAVWVFIVGMSNKSENKSSWPGVAILLQNILILISTLIFKFVRDEDESF